MKSANQNTGLSQYIAGEYKNLVLYVKRFINERYYNVNAEDIVQDVALNLFTKVDFDSKIENIAGYVYRSVRNRIVDVQRKHKHDIPISPSSSRGDGGDAGFIASILSVSDEVSPDVIDTEVFYQKLDDAFKLLPTKQKAIIVATLIEGRSFNEVAEAWNVPVGTLLSWKHRGIAKLRKSLKLSDFYISHNQI